MQQGDSWPLACPASFCATSSTSFRLKLWHQGSGRGEGFSTGPGHSHSPVLLLLLLQNRSVRVLAHHSSTSVAHSVMYALCTLLVCASDLYMCRNSGVFTQPSGHCMLRSIAVQADPGG